MTNTRPLGEDEMTGTADYGAVRTGRATVYRGITMRSRLEAGFAQWLDNHDWRWTYDPRTYASPLGQYLPDFEVWSDRDPEHIFIEVRPADINVIEIATTLKRMHIIRASVPDAPLFLKGGEWWSNSRRYSWSDLALCYDDDDGDTLCGPCRAAVAEALEGWPLPVPTGRATLGSRAYGVPPNDGRADTTSQEEQ